LWPWTIFVDLRNRYRRLKTEQPRLVLVYECCGPALSVLRIMGLERHPFPLLPQLGSAAFGFGYFMTRDWYDMSHDFPSSSLEPCALLVREQTGAYRPAQFDEVLRAAQLLLVRRVRGSDALATRNRPVCTVLI
jgi:hypothetical protein